jgi:hypothetical protein
MGMWFLPLFGHQSPLHEDLLDSARRFIAQEHHGVAVVLAQTAAEVFTEQMRTQLVQRQVSADVGKWIVSRTGRARARIDFYVAVTGDRIKDDHEFWPEYTKHLARRNEVVHQGRRVSKEEAEHSCRVVQTMISRMVQVLRAP